MTRRCSAETPGPAGEGETEDSDAAGGEDKGGEEAPLGDWRAFRAKLVSSSEGEAGGAGWRSRTSRANMQLLAMQDPALAEEDFFCFPLPRPEEGCLLLAGETGEGVPPQLWQAVLLVLQHGPEGSAAVVLNRPTRYSVGELGPPAGWGMEQVWEPEEGVGAAGSSGGLAGFASQCVYYGGALAQQGVSVVHPCGEAEGAREVFPGVFTGGMEWLFAQPVRCRARARRRAFAKSGAAAHPVGACGQRTDARRAPLYTHAHTHAWPRVHARACCLSAGVQPGELRPSRVRFFAGMQMWGPGELEREVAAGAWYAASASRPVVLKQCLSLPVPLWRECMELMGGEYAGISKRTYGVDAVEDDE